MSETIVRAKINPDLLVWARSTMGFSVEEVARSVGVDPVTVGEWENGRKLPTIRQLQVFANKVKRPVAALFLSERPQDPPQPDDYRLLPGTVQGAFQPDTILAIRKVRNALRSTSDLAEDDGTPRRMDMPRISLKHDPETAAAALRSKLGIDMQTQMRWRDGYTALREWRDALFGVGVLTFQFGFPNSDARGFNLIENDLGAIAVSTQDAVVARIFSMFHECCHLCLRRPGVSGPPMDGEPELKTVEFAVERYCDRFAAGFLLPLQYPEVSSALSCLAREGRDDRSLNSAAGRFKVSREVLIRRMESAGYVGWETVQECVQRWRAQATGRRSGISLPDRSCVGHYGKGYVSMVLDALDSGRITQVEARRYLDVSPKWFDKVRAGLSAGGADE